MALRTFGVPGGARARVYAYGDDVSIFCVGRTDIQVLQKALEVYEKIKGAKINCNKSSDFLLGYWKGVALPEPLECDFCLISS